MKLNENSLKLYKLSLLLVWEDCVASYSSYTNHVSIIKLLHRCYDHINTKHYLTIICVIFFLSMSFLTCAFY